MNITESIMNIKLIILKEAKEVGKTRRRLLGRVQRQQLIFVRTHVFEEYLSLELILFN